MNMKRTALTGIILGISAYSLAVTTVITRHEAGKDFIKGELENVVADSAGTLRLARQSEELDCGDLLSDALSVHTLFAGDDAIYLGTGPNAAVIRWADQKAHLIYPPQQADVNDVADSEIRNEHVFALSQDLAGRLLIGVSGETGKLVRLAQEPETVFEDDRVKYIFAIVRDSDNNIYLGTGPEGLIFRLDPFCQDPQVIYDAQDKSILSLAVHDGIIYAGSDQRGVIYKIEPETKRTTVLYDAEQDEVSALVVDSAGNIYAAATSAQAAMLQLKASEISLNRSPGRPDSSSDAASPSDTSESLNTANSDESETKEEKKPTPTAPTPPPAKVAGHIYKITPDGFVTDIFGEIAVLYALAQSEGKLYLGTGNKGQLFSIDPETEETSILFEDETSSQITSAVQVDGAMFLGLSNPPRLIRMDEALAPIGIFESDLIDAGQPARWGKLQIEANIPAGCQVTMVSRSGNMKDPNDSTFSDWSEEVILSDATQLECPVGRYCQYRLTLATNSEQATPVIREVAVAHVIPNLAPTVKLVRVQRSRDKNSPHLTEIMFTATDDNKDELMFTLDFRKAGRSRWILLEEDLDKPRFQWDSRTVEDGRYEIRVTADDRKDNSPETMLTGSRISDVFVIDNTPPEFKDVDVEVQGRDVDIKLVIEDAFSTLGKVQYTVDSNEKWITLLPDDLVYDTLTETFTFRIDAIKSGDHVIAFSAADDLENTRYHTVEVSIP